MGVDESGHNRGVAEIDIGSRTPCDSMATMRSPRIVTVPRSSGGRLTGKIQRAVNVQGDGLRMVEPNRLRNTEGAAGFLVAGFQFERDAEVVGEP